MNWKKALGFGALIWIIMFVVISVFVGYGWVTSDESGWSMWSILTLAVTVLVTYFIARKIAPASYGLALGYGVAFAVVGIILDYFISTRFAPNIFSSTSYWMSYIILALTPLSVVKKATEQVQSQ
jgi:hypothetical protein